MKSLAYFPIYARNIKRIYYSTASSNNITGMKMKIDNLLKSNASSTILAENKAKELVSSYSSLKKSERDLILQLLAFNYGTNVEQVMQSVNNISLAKDKGSVAMIGSITRLKQSLIPPYQILFTLISRLEGGVKFLVDMRAEVLNFLQERKQSSTLSDINKTDDTSYVNALNSCLKDLLLAWFSVGFLQLERITWKSSCDMLQKISEYEAVHPIRNWADL